MKKLFIIGNGFDLAHNLKTSYEDFHNYLKGRFPDSVEDRLVVPRIQMDWDGNLKCNKTDVISLLRFLISRSVQIGNCWGDVEASLGHLDFSECFEDLPIFVDEDGDPDRMLQFYNIQDRAGHLIDIILSVTDYFSEWINRVNISAASPKKDFLNCINPMEDLFLSFNYTNTLEKLYHVQKVCHIHGKQGSPLLFGHGVDRNLKKESATPFGAEQELQTIHEGLRKDTVKAIQNNYFFFEHEIDHVESIYSYGFSYSQVDRPYIQLICQRLQSKIRTWFFHDGEPLAKRQHYQGIVQSCGYQGTFSTFHIS